MRALAGAYRLPGENGGYVLTAEGPTLFIEAAGQGMFAVLHSVREAEPGRLSALNILMDRIVAGNMKGDFKPLFTAYGGEVKIERLKANWAESMKMIAADHGRVLRSEILGSARTQERDETVVRLHGERGHTDLTYVWDIAKQGRLLGRSARGLAVRMRLCPAGERELFTWDGGIRPPKTVRIEPGPDGRLTLRLGDSPPAIRDWE